jgi:hypothetical protein
MSKVLGDTLESPCEWLVVLTFVLEDKDYTSFFFSHKFDVLNRLTEEINRKNISKIHVLGLSSHLVLLESSPECILLSHVGKIPLQNIGFQTEIRLQNSSICRTYLQH